jgi:GT2 family glycosyltransferase
MDIPNKSKDEQRAFFESVHERATKAENARGKVSNLLNVAGQRIRLVFAGDQLAGEFMPALAHLCVMDDDRADAVFHIWDSESTGIEMVEPPCSLRQFTDRGDIWGFNGESYRVAFHWIECSVNLFDREAQTGIWWVQSARALPYWTKASPFRSLFQWWAELNGKQLLHAAAIGTEHGAALITGKGGVGKSTTALSALSRGLKYLGDDYLITSLDPVPRVHSLYSTAKLNPEQVARFPALAALVANDAYLGEQKAVLRLFPSRADQIACSLPMRVVLTPRFGTGAETTFAPVSAEILCRASAFTTMSQLPYSGRYTNEFIQRMIGCLPGLELVLGSDLGGVITAIEDLLDRRDEEITSLAQPRRKDKPTPLISVIIPVHNGAHFLPEAIASVLAQDYPAFEIIVVDDGSTDDIESVIAALPTDVRFLKQVQAGPAAARNTGIRDASGELIAFLDVDDLWPSNNLHVLVEALNEHPDDGVVHGYGQLMAGDGKDGPYDFVGNPHEAFPFYLGAGLYRKSVFEKIGLFDGALVFGEDTDWYGRAQESGTGVLRLPLVTLLVRRHGQNMTSNKSTKDLMALRLFKKKLERKRAQDRNAATRPAP